MLQREEEIRSFTQFFNQYNGRFMAFAATYVGKDAAEDIVMDAFLYYWERRNSLKNSTNLPAYILTTIKHKCLNHLRSQKLRTHVEQKLTIHASDVLNLKISTLEVLDPDEIFSEKVHKVIHDAIDSLPERTRKIFIMSRIEEKSYKEIAELYAITVKSVEFEIAKATRLLRTILKKSSFYVLAMIYISL